MLKVEDLQVAYGEANVLFDVDLAVHSGEIVSLLGSNGAGKSTTLKAISGVVPAKGGKVTFQDKDITNKQSHEIMRMGITHCPEGRRLFGKMTVEENLLLGAITEGARRQADETIAEVMDLFPILKERRNQMAGLLSGGQQQMVAIGRSMMAKPDFLMLDEPSLGLAPLIVKEVFDVIGRLRETGATVLLVEQNVAQALSVSDRAYVLERGQIVMSGDSAELKGDPELQRAYMGI